MNETAPTSREIARSISERGRVEPRVLYFTGEYPRVSDTFIQREVVALRAMGLCVHTAAVRRPGHDAATAPIDGEPTAYLLPAGPVRIVRAHSGCLWRNPRGYFGAAKILPGLITAGFRDCFLQFAYFLEAGLLVERLRETGSTHLHNHFANSSCSVAMLAARMAGIPFSFTLHGPAIFFEARRWRLDLKLRAAAWVNCISHFCASQAAVFAPDAAHKFRILRCAVEPEEYGPSSDVLPNENDFSAGDSPGAVRRLLFVGRLATVKGLPVLFQAIDSLRATYPDLRLSVVGDGPRRADFEASVRARGLESFIEFRGARSAQEVRAELAAADAFVLPSYAEGVPVVLMEAMAAGVPVIATRIAGIPELIEDGRSGYLAPPANAPALAAAIEALLNASPPQREQLIDRARRTIENDFNLRYEARKLYEWFSAGHRTSVPEVQASAVAARETTPV